MGCRPSRSSLSKIGDKTSDYNRCHLKEFDKARRKMRDNQLRSRRKAPTYNEFSSTSRVYHHQSRRSKVTVRLSTDGSMLEIEQYELGIGLIRTTEEATEDNVSTADGPDVTDAHRTSVNDGLASEEDRRCSTAPVCTPSRPSDLTIISDCYPVQSQLNTSLSHTNSCPDQVGDRNSLKLQPSVEHTVICDSHYNNNDTVTKAGEIANGNVTKDVSNQCHTKYPPSPLGVETYERNTADHCIMCNFNKHSGAHCVTFTGKIQSPLAHTIESEYCSNADKLSSTIVKQRKGACLCGGKDTNSNVASDCKCEFITGTFVEDTVGDTRHQPNDGQLDFVSIESNSYTNQQDPSDVIVCKAHSRDILNGNIDSLYPLKSSGVKTCESLMMTMRDLIKARHAVKMCYEVHDNVKPTPDHYKHTPDEADSAKLPCISDNNLTRSVIATIHTEHRQNITPISLEHSFTGLNSHSKSIYSIAPTEEKETAKISEDGNKTNSDGCRSARGVYVTVKSALELSDASIDSKDGYRYLPEIQGNLEPGKALTNNIADVTIDQRLTTVAGSRCHCNTCSLTLGQQDSEEEENMEFYSDFDNDVHHTNFTDVDDGDEDLSDDDSITSLRDMYKDYKDKTTGVYHCDRLATVTRSNGGQLVFSDNENDADIDSSEDERDVYIDAMETSYV